MCHNVHASKTYVSSVGWFRRQKSGGKQQVMPPRCQPARAAVAEERLVKRQGVEAGLVNVAFPTLPLRAKIRARLGVNPDCKRVNGHIVTQRAESDQQYAKKVPIS